MVNIPFLSEKHREGKILLNRLAELVREVAQTAVMPRFLNAAVSTKSDGTRLTEADLHAQALFAERLPQIINCPMLGEEMSADEQHAIWQHAATGRAQLGTIFHPMMQEMFTAERGHGAYLNGRPLPLRNTPKKLHESIAGVEVKYLRSGKLASRMQTLHPFGSQRSMGSSTLDWCYLAAGRYDLYLHGGQKLWDYAAGALIYEEAGGRLATLEGDDFWSGEHVFKRSVIAGLQPDLFERWLAWIRANQ